MNSQQQIVKALSMLQLAYSTDMSVERMKLYVTMLGNINPVTLEQAVANLINKCKFLPTIAEIREECTALSAYVNMHDEVETAQTAWEKVIKVAGTYGYDNGKEHLEVLLYKLLNRYGHRSTLEWAMSITRQVAGHSLLNAMNN